MFAAALSRSAQSMASAQQMASTLASGPVESPTCCYQKVNVEVAGLLLPCFVQPLELLSNAESSRQLHSENTTVIGTTLDLGSTNQGNTAFSCGNISLQYTSFANVVEMLAWSGVSTFEARLQTAPDRDSRVRTSVIFSSDVCVSPFPLLTHD